MKGLNKSVTWSFLLNGTIALIGIIRSKYLAVTFGASAVGLLSQVLQLQLVAITIGSLGLMNGLVSGIAKSGNNEVEKQHYISTSFTIQLFLSTILVLVVCLFSSFFSEFTFGSRDYSHLILLTMLGVPFLVLANHQLQAIFFANNGFDLLNKSAVIVNILNLILFFILVKIWDINGAMATATTLAILQFVFFLYFSKTFWPIKKILSLYWNLEKAKYLIIFAATSLSTYLLIYGSHFLIRREVIHELGLEMNGILQVPVSLSMYYVPLISWVLWGKVYPVLVREQLKAAENFKKVVIRSLLGFLLLATFIVFLKEHIILILLTKDFLPALPLISKYILGDFLFILCTLYGAYIMALHKLKVYLIGHVLFVTVYLTGVFILLKNYQLMAIPISLIMAGSATLLAMFVYLLMKYKSLVDVKILSVIIFGIVYLGLIGNF